MGYNKWNNADDFILGRRYYDNDDDVAGVGDNNNSGFNGNNNDVETIVSPTETVVNTTTNQRTVRRVHPTHVVHVNRNVTRVENYYPVKESVRNVNSVEEYNCGSDLRNPRCRPVKRRKKKML